MRLRFHMSCFSHFRRPRARLDNMAKDTKLETAPAASHAANATLTERSNCGEPCTLSAIEILPAEVVQNIASYLLCGYRRDPEDTIFVSDAAGRSFDGLLELRATSRTLRAKTDYIFNNCFDTLIVGYEPQGLLRLWAISNNDTLRHRVRSLVFVARPLGTVADQVQGYRKLGEVAKIPEVRQLSRQDSLDTIVIAAAMKRLRLHSVFIAPSLITWYSEWVLEASDVHHPPTVILNATLLSRVKIERFEMGGGSWGSCHGIKPYATDLPALAKSGWSQVRNLTSITLTLSSSGCKSRAASNICDVWLTE